MGMMDDGWGKNVSTYTFFFVIAHWEPTESPKEIALPPTHSAVVASSSSPAFAPPGSKDNAPVVA